MMYNVRRVKGRGKLFVTVTYLDGKVEYLLFRNHTHYLQWNDEVYEAEKNGTNNIKYVSCKRIYV